MAARRKSARLGTQLCPRFQTAVAILSRRWTGLIVRALLDGPLRYSELLDRLEVVGDRMLSERLKELEAEGIIERRVLAGQPVRVEYRLSRKGRALDGVVDAIGEWAERWLKRP